MSKLENLNNEITLNVIKAINEGGLEFNSASSIKIESLLDDWKELTFSNTNLDNYNIIQAPFAVNSFKWPVLSYGKLDSSCFFSFLEFGMWLSYKFTGNHKSFWDVGAHHGIDSFIMKSYKPSSSVLSFEPDPLSYKTFKEIIELNKKFVSNEITARNSGLSNVDSTESFIRVLGNTTASHFSGSREHHGEIEEFKVKLESHKRFNYPSLMKVNIEGYEKYLVPSFDSNIFDNLTMLIEIHSEQDMSIVKSYADKNKIRIFTQSSGFKHVDSLDHLPKSNKEGYVLLKRTTEDNALHA